MQRRSEVKHDVHHVPERERRLCSTQKSRRSRGILLYRVEGLGESCFTESCMSGDSKEELFRSGPVAKLAGALRALRASQFIAQSDWTPRFDS